ncbi:Ricin [Drechslerella dactyloides]|uniref:rRNA N-glycosylase n=1 Tax=Drechslerella dactyloides TaxID=74499 RepID=A0AAD6IUC1_DREDA|nr:Ricin [Drechslerella dactyloides]
MVRASVTKSSRGTRAQNSWVHILGFRRRLSGFGIMMGRDALLAAVLTLLSGTEASVQDQANAYLVIIQMIAEAMRFDSILNHLTLVDPRRGISTHWRSGTYLTRDMVTMQNHWKTVSDAVLYHAQADNTESERQLVRVNNQLQVRLTFQQFLQIIGVLLWSNNQKGYRPNAPGPSGMGKRDVDFLAARVAGDSPVPAEGWIPKGQDMFQILEVNAVVNGQNWLRAYGDGWIITELHGSVPQYFFEYNNFMVCQVIGNIKTAIGGALAVAEAQYATGHISVTGNLYSYNIVGKDDTITTNDSTIEWDYSNSDFNVYDEVQTVRLSGKDGHADVKFVVMTDARRVGISITALDIDGKDSIYMYGDITATATILGESRSFKLFTIGDREEIHWTVDKGDEIPGPWALAIPMKQKKSPTKTIWIPTTSAKKSTFTVPPRRTIKLPTTPIRSPTSIKATDCDVPTPGPTIDFTTTLSIDGTAAGAKRYKRFIENLRTDVVDPQLPPVLIQQQRKPTQFFEVVLEAKGVAVTIRIRRDNLYIVGHRTEGTKSVQWKELHPGYQPKSQTDPIRCPLIYGATFMAFAGNYLALETYAQQKRATIELGPAALRSAINDLASDSTSGKKQALAYLVIIQMVTDAAKFGKLFDLIQSTWSKSIPPKAFMIARGDAWSPLSTALLHASTEPGPEIPDLRLHPTETLDPSDTQRSDLQAAVLLRVNPPGQHAGDGVWVPKGRQLLRIHDIYPVSKNGDCINLFGTVKVTDAMGTWTLWDQDDEHTEKYCPAAGSTLWPNPNWALSAEGYFKVAITLKSSSGGGYDLISNGVIEWDALANTNVNIYDQDQRVKLHGKNGNRAVVRYSVLSNGAEGRFEFIVNPIKAKNKDAFQIAGDIFARNEGGQAYLYDYPEHPVSITPDQKVDMKPGDPIPLSTKMMVIPVSNSMDLSINIKVGNDHIKADYKTIVVQPNFRKPSTFVIKGNQGFYQLEGKITWI